ncbi:hypothetical protein BDEG_23884 [Batrachochytrium dendrobatidis JEL423]|uniref:DNA-directed RNA polymerase subunit n=1 Tax=Batrachochytrium dendrobatidis (strain JEL423) TaxID=403673 RepID=A0A177WL44_BATDL|nr:hypothetical protein BDEG_23884 [Batrachochytrium dendrobatidis JEL423]
MNISNPVSAEVRSVHFSFYSPQDLRKLSVKQITNPIIFDNLDHPTPQGLYDSALGPSGIDSTCSTCSLGFSNCPGHFGHIELSVPVYNSVNFKLLYKLLQSTCYYCHHLRTSRSVIHSFVAKLKLIHAGLIVEAAELDSALFSEPLINTSDSPKNSSSTNKSSTFINDEAEEDHEDMISKSFMNVDTEDSEPQDSAGSVNFEKRTSAQIITAIDRFVDQAFAKNPYTRPSKVTLLTANIRRLERQFFSAIPAQTCQNCRGQSPKFRKDGESKIFEQPLNNKQKMSMNTQNLTPENLFGPKMHAVDDDNEKTAQQGDAVSQAIDSQREIFLTPLQVKAHIELLWKRETVVLDLLFGNSSSKKSPRVSSPLMFFLDVVSVTPNRFRPISKMGDSQYENPQNIFLTAILKANVSIQELQRQEEAALKVIADDPKLYQLQKAEFLRRIIDAWMILQNSVNYLLDSSKCPLSVSGKIAPPGIRQLLEKKEGLFRKHMMGKRVNHAARSVISPDPYIETNEIGIPPVFASKLTYPEPVTHHNIKEMRRCVVNGPLKWPGATHVENEDGTLISLSSFDDAGRTAIANQLLTPSMHHGETNHSYNFDHVNKKVYRHIRNGDFLLLNRQPTLHKPSIMAHTARVLPGEKTIRMHYANCNTYNADFDGDEMNIHFPQNEIARAEAMLIARNDQQYLVPTDGGVLRGLIQDHVDAGVDMCSRDTFFNRETYMQLVYIGLCPEGSVTSTVGNGNIEPPIVIGRNGRVVTLPPAIIKPVAKWTGKQIISTILVNLIPEDRNLLNLVSKSRIPAKQWGPSAPEEQTVIFMDGDLLTGILDKSQFGASANGLVHAVYEVYGASYAGKLLSILGRLFTSYLQFAGFTCRMDDLRLTPEGDAVRCELIESASSIGLDAISEITGVNVEGISHDKRTMYMARSKGDKTALAKNIELNVALEQVLRNSEKMAALDSAMKSRTNKVTSKIISSCVPDRLLKPFPHNNMQVMTVSGAKGSGVNVSQISCLLGQQELEGKRVPTMISGKTLPSFLAYDTSARAGGYITGRFLTGIKPQEYYFHCMAGREGLIDTAVKTSRSGYLQRCLIKHLEGLSVHYDHTVRDMDGSLLQFQYGEDALDVVKQTTLQKFDFCALNYRALLKRYDPSALAGKVDDESLERYLKKQRKQDRESIRESGGSFKPNHDPILSIFSPSRHIGSVSDGFADALSAYIEKNTSQLLYTSSSKKTHKNRTDENGEARPVKDTWSVPKISARKFKVLMELRYMHSLVEPGEAVGLLAAQSIGEPSTQMTLNTFHFAGFGAKNVTLGIPRLREIIMTASQSIQTPLMRLPLKQEATVDQAHQIADQISRVVLSQIMHGVTVSETLVPKTPERQKRVKQFCVRLELWPQEACQRQYGITDEDIGNIIEKKFVPILDRTIMRMLKVKFTGDNASTEADEGQTLASLGFTESSVEKTTKSSKPQNDGDEDESNGLDNGRSTNFKSSHSLIDRVVDAADLSDAEGDDSEVSDDDGDNDATAVRQNTKRQQQATYDGPDEDDEQVIEHLADIEMANDDDKVSVNTDPDSVNDADDGLDLDGFETEKHTNGINRSVRIQRASRFVSGYKFHKGSLRYCELTYELSTDTKKILMLPLVEEVCSNLIVRQVPGVSRCYYLPNESENDKSVNVGTDGVNLKGIWEYDNVIDVNKIGTNDIAAILHTYGVEAARAAIMQEIAGVFGVYGIQVDSRHLSIIADYMTFEGGYKAFNRTCMGSNPSPFLQMSFETTTSFLTTATLTGDSDPLDSPSARIVMGQAVKTGTGSFSVLQPLVRSARG